MDGLLIIAVLGIWFWRVDKPGRQMRRSRKQRLHEKQAKDAVKKAKWEADWEANREDREREDLKSQLSWDGYNIERALLGVYRGQVLDIYLVELTGKKYDERFYKIGITRNGIHKRDPGGPFYNHKVITHIPHQDATLAILFEQALHGRLMYSDHKYHPKDFLIGFTECYKSFPENFYIRQAWSEFCRLNNHFDNAKHRLGDNGDGLPDIRALMDEIDTDFLPKPPSTKKEQFWNNTRTRLNTQVQKIKPQVDRYLQDASIRIEGLTHKTKSFVGRQRKRTKPP